MTPKLVKSKMNTSSAAARRAGAGGGGGRSREAGAGGVRHVQRRRAEMQKRHQSEVDPAARPDERAERSGDDERGHDERDAREGAQHAFATKLAARDEKRAGQPGEQG